jgi:hypothetical protein
MRNLGREERALEYYSGVLQIAGGAFVLVGGFAAASLSVSRSPAFHSIIGNSAPPRLS